ncbi:hypothetical protein HUK80_04585 [Flavobacterium sp. MAH-1]|uniref:Uncharacterized protein n=1 Tax=Flavobacterium agri TaxID=2743471 RepID=A0A7Y9C6G0_9FLAO|nr:hypothetical protein [Flavobacterium agri]NUY80162.1 hypothetical protein [Flavobacterium agri]NYA70187.1 hypothetical protein [Flavobacterium agri]
MMNSFGRWRPIVEIVGISILAAALHALILHLFNVGTDAFVYAPLELYAYFLIASVIILLVLIIVEKRNKDNVGYTFLIITSAKMVFAYFLLRPVLAHDLKIEKINFFVIFALFLAFETITASRMLNRD